VIEDKLKAWVCKLGGSDEQVVALMAAKVLENWERGQKTRKRVEDQKYTGSKEAIEDG
jgi:hypothetical protein